MDIRKIGLFVGFVLEQLELCGVSKGATVDSFVASQPGLRAQKANQDFRGELRELGLDVTVPDKAETSVLEVQEKRKAAAEAKKAAKKEKK